MMLLVLFSSSDTLRWGQKPGYLICPDKCYLILVMCDGYLVPLSTIRKMLMLTRYQENRGPFSHDCTHLQLQSSYRPHKKSGRMSSREQLDWKHFSYGKLFQPCGLEKLSTRGKKEKKKKN